MLIVCPLRHVDAVVAARGPSHVISLLAPDAPFPACETLPPGRHLKLAFNDIMAPADDMVAPCQNTVQAIVDFYRAWDRRAPMLIHCWAGISRSTAAAYIIACLHAGPGTEEELAARLRIQSPSATPNRLMIALADEMLGREGRMIAAIQRIGRGAEAFEGAPFDLALAP